MYQQIAVHTCYYSDYTKLSRDCEYSRLLWFDSDQLIGRAASCVLSFMVRLRQIFRCPMDGLQNMLQKYESLFTSAHIPILIP